MYCNEYCKKLRATINSHEGGRYEQGQKRCSQCEIFIEWKGLHCPCCGRLLRTKPRATKLTRRLSLMRQARLSKLFL